MLLLIIIKKLWSLIQNPSQEISQEVPLAEKSRWRHIRLAMAPRYLGNISSQMKSYWGTLWGSNERSFRIRHRVSPKAPPSGEITMTSYPTFNKTSLSRKSCIPDKRYYETLSGSHGRTFRIRHAKSREDPPGVEITMTSFFCYGVS